MSLKTFVKINRITNLTDARYCAGMNANAIGFSVESDSPHYISPSLFEEITGWISGIDFAAEFKRSTSEEVKEILKNYGGITWIESEHIETIMGLKNEGFHLIYKLPIENIFRLEKELEEMTKDQSVILHLTSSKGILASEDLNQLKLLSGFGKILLGFGITPENASELGDIPSIHGLCLDSGDEIKPGLRDFDQLADILESLEIYE